MKFNAIRAFAFLAATAIAINVTSITRSSSR